MSLDYAREAAVEAGYLHPDADVSDFLNALRRNAQGQRVFNESDPGAVEWREFERARRRGDFEGTPPIPGEPANFDAAAAKRYRDAATATRERAQTFSNPIVGPVLRERSGTYAMPESRVPERFISSPEGVRAFMDAGGDAATLKDALVADLRRTGANFDGTLNAAKFNFWQKRRAAALREFPDLQRSLGDVAKAQDAVDAVAAVARQQSLEFERGAARHFLNAEPVQAVRSALNSKNPVSDMRELSRMVSGDPDAKAGLQRAVADHIAQTFVRGAEGEAAASTSKREALNAFLTKNLALREVFSAEQLKAMQNLADDLQRAGQQPPAARASGSGAARTVLGELSRLGSAGLAGYLLGDVGGALGSAGAYAVGKTAVDALRRAGVERVDQLLTEALLNPDMAKTLLMKATPANKPLIAQRLASQVGTLTAAAGTEAVEERPSRKVSQVGTPLPAEKSAPFNPAMPPPTWGSLAPGGALLPRAQP